jgi:hypothetical protein
MEEEIVSTGIWSDEAVAACSLAQLNLIQPSFDGQHAL